MAKRSLLSERPLYICMYVCITQCLLGDFCIRCNWNRPILCIGTDEIGKNVGYACIFYQCRHFGVVLIM